VSTRERWHDGQTIDLVVSGVLLLICAVFLSLTLRTQMMLTLHEPTAISGLSFSPPPRFYGAAGVGGVDHGDRGAAGERLWLSWGWQFLA
jgi:hypothetical protein